MTTDGALIVLPEGGAQALYDAVNRLTAERDDLRTEVERLRRIFSAAIDDLKRGASVPFAACTWCGATWPRGADDSKERVLRDAYAHATTCEVHPLKAERDALRADLEAMRKERDDARADLSDLAGTGLAALAEAYGMPVGDAAITLIEKLDTAYKTIDSLHIKDKRMRPVVEASVELRVRDAGEHITDDMSIAEAEAQPRTMDALMRWRCAVDAYRATDGATDG